MLNGEEIKRLAAEKGCGVTIVTVEETGSTNDELKKLAAAGAPHGYVLIAGKQTSGRGRMGHSFFSPVTGVYLSVLLRPHTPPEQTLHLTAAAGIAVCRAVESLTDKKAQIKWVNDIYIEGRKVCGILTESALSGGCTEWAVVGMGINVTEPRDGFPDDIRERACALFRAENETPPLFRERFAAELLSAFERQTALPWEETLSEYRRRSYLTGKEVILSDGSRAEVTGISESGSLTVMLDSGEIRDISSQFSVKEC